jgi:bifunctional non-homologous end joining protein LigD
MVVAEEFELDVEGRLIRITNPQKPIWPDVGLSKLDFIRYLTEISSFMLPYIKNRMLTTIRFPNGIHGKSFYQKNIPEHAPQWVSTHNWRDTTYILANDLPTLIWLGNQACLELHAAFNRIDCEKCPTELVLDLDPTDTDNFSLVLEIALLIKENLDRLGLFSQPKTSGATGIQIYIPIEARYHYEQTRMLGKFIAQYIAEKHPNKVTLERLVKNRGVKLYIDYLQHWEGKTLAAPYTPRAREGAPVSAPVSWQEVEKGFQPLDFRIDNIRERIQSAGDLFAPITTQRKDQSLDELLNFIGSHT